MCLGIPGQIVELLGNPHLAMADVFGARRQINVGLLEDGVGPGDWVLLHVGFAIEKLGPDELAQVQASLHLTGNQAGEDDPLAELERELAERSKDRAARDGGNFRQGDKEEVEEWA